MLKSLVLFAFVLNLHGAFARAEIVGDDACFVISGGNADRQGVFSFLKNHGDFIAFQGYPQCRIFNGYAALNSFLKTGKLSDGRRATPPKVNAPIVIVTQAHGSDDGSQFTDDGVIDADQVLEKVREISILHPVAFYSATCYSGNLLLQKNRWEQTHASELAHEGNDSIDRVCLWAEALPGRITNGSTTVNDQIEIPAGTASNFEETYLRHPQGILSSAAWGELQLEPYFGSGFDTEAQIIHEGREATHLKQGQHVLQAMIQLFSRKDDSSLSDKNRAMVESARFLISPESGGADFLKASNRLTKADPATEALFFQYLSTQTDAGTCADRVKADLLKNYYLLFRASGRNLSWGPILSHWMNEALNSESPLQGCGEFSKNQSLKDWANWFRGYSPSLASTINAYISNFQILLKAVGLPSNAALSSPEEIVSYVSGRLSSSNAVPANLISKKQKILDSSVGRFVFASEFKSNFRQLIPAANFDIGSTGNVLPAFVIESIRARDLSNRFDQRRRNACRNIEIKGSFPSR